jgi:hypothetical protein
VCEGRNSKYSKECGLETRSSVSRREQRKRMKDDDELQHGEEHASVLIPLTLSAARS